MKHVLVVLVLLALFILYPDTGADASEQFIVFCSDRDGDNEIYRMETDGSNVVQLTFNTHDEFGSMCSPDGRRIAFESNRDGNYDIFVINIDGSGLQQFTSDPADDFHADWARDGSKLCFSSERDGDRELFVINGDGSGLQQVTHNTVDDSAPGWSPDGSKIVFHKNRLGVVDIWTIDSGGGSPLNLTTDAVADFMPDWAPGGGEIVFESYRHGPLELYIMNADGSGIRRLTYDNSDNHEPDWSPDGSKIVYVSMQGGDFDLKTIYPDGTGSQNLTNNSGINDFSPSWCRVVVDESNNGGGTGALAYCNQPVSAPDIHEIYTVIIDGTQNQKLIDATMGLNHHEWSPDGRSMATVGYVNATTSSIYKFESGGANLTRLTSTAGVWDNEPSWSPDGTKIAWGRIYHAEGYRTELWIMDADGGDPHSIGVAGGGVKWSPDGARLVYFKELAAVDIWTCAVDGSDEQQLTMSAGDNMAPDWSPDGSKIVFVSTRDGNHEIYVMETDGSLQRRITSNGVMDFTPTWSPDGSKIAFGRDVSGTGRWEVFVMDSTGADVERVTFSRSDRTAINPDWQPVDTSSVPVYLSRLVCETSGWSITTRWEVVENAVAGDFRVETKSRGRLRTVQVTALGPRRFEATDDHPDLRANDSVVYSLYARGDGGGWDLLGTQTASLSPATAGITGVYPNPFNPHTAVSFAVGAPGSVRIDIYDVTGRFVARLADRFYGAGNYTVRWDGRDAAGGEAASGIYLLRLSVNKKTETRKLALIR